MNQSQDEARAARIQKYKEERRKQLTAKTASLFSNNVTDRRPKPCRTQSEDVESTLKASSSSTNIPSAAVIRTTRTSRLRAAAATNHTDLPTPRNRLSASTTSLLDDKQTKTEKNAPEKDKNKATYKRQKYGEKENVKSASTSALVKGNGATSKLRHSSKISLDRDRVKNVTKLEKDVASDIDVCASGSERMIRLVDYDVATKGFSDNNINFNLETLAIDIDESKELIEKPETKDLTINLMENQGKLNLAIDINNDKKAKKDNKTSPKKSSRKPVKIDSNKEKCEVIALNADKPRNTDEAGLLNNICVKEVQSFSELLSNLCSPVEADLLFEDILSDEATDNNLDVSRTEPSKIVPCRRTHQPPNSSTPLRAGVPPPTPPSPDDGQGIAAQTKTRSPISSPRPKTESPLPSSKSSPKNTRLCLQKKHSPSPPTSARNRSFDSGKPSSIPVTKRSAEKNRNTPSPVKQALTRDTKKPTDPKHSKDRKSKQQSVSDTESARRDRAQKHSQCVSEKSNSKRLTSLERSNANTAHKLPQPKLSDSDSAESNFVDTKANETMYTLHETMRPHAGTTRLSKEMDDLAELTKQTLDRVNKLTNNLASSKSNVDKNEYKYENGLTKRPYENRGVTERLRDIDSAAQRLIDFEKQSVMFSDLNNDVSSQSHRSESLSASISHTPVSILKRKSLLEENTGTNSPSHAISSPPVTFSPSVLEICNNNANRQRQGILKKRRSLDESQVARRRSCSPEVSFADDGSQDTNKPILKNRRSSLEDVIRNRSPDAHIHSILKRKMSKEEEHITDVSHGSPEPQGILKRKSNSSSSSSTTSSHVSIAQAVLLAAAGGAEIVDDEKETMRPILKKKSSSEERPLIETILPEVPKPILKKKSIEIEDYDLELPKKPILKSSRKCFGDDGQASSFDISEDERGSRRPSLLRSRTSDHSGSECETTVRPILKQLTSSMTRERSQSPRPRLSFCGDSDAAGVPEFSSDSNDPPAAADASANPDAGSSVQSAASFHPSAVIRRRNQRPKNDHRSRSLACNFDDELLSILNNRRLKVDECSGSDQSSVWERQNRESEWGNDNQDPYPPIALRIKSMEQTVNKVTEPKDLQLPSRARGRDRDRFKTQPITIDEMRYITSLESGQESFRAFGPTNNSFPSGSVEIGASDSARIQYPQVDHYALSLGTLKAPHYIPNCDTNAYVDDVNRHVYGEANFLDYDNGDRGHITLDDIEKEVEKVRLALDADSRALDEEERQQAEADTWSLNVSCDSGVYNRASSRDSGPHSGEELGLIECQEIKENTATNGGCHHEDWSASSLENGLHNMEGERERRSTESEDHRSDGSDEEGGGFALGLVKSNSVIARASMWQQLQQQAKGAPKPLLRHKSRGREASSLAERFKSQPIAFKPDEASQEDNYGLTQSKSTANVLDRDEDAKLDEDDPAKLSLSEKMKMFNSKLTHKPPMAGLPKAKEERAPRASRLKTMPVLASQVQEAIETNERLTKSLTNDEVPRNPDFQRTMELFRSASSKNASLEYLMRRNAKYRSLDLEDDSRCDSNRTMTPESRFHRPGVTNLAPRPRPLAKGESSEGLKDEGIDSSSDESSSSVTSSERTTSDTSEDIPGPKHRRFHNRKNKLKPSKTDSDLARVLKTQTSPQKVPGIHEPKETLVQAKNCDVKIPTLAKLRRSSESKVDENEPNSNSNKRVVTKLIEPIQLGKLRRSTDKVIKVEEKPPVMKIAVLSQEAKNKYFGLSSEKSIDEITAAVRRYIPSVSKSMSVHAMVAPPAAAGSGSDEGESSGGREVSEITHHTSRNKLRGGFGVQRSATHAEMPHKGGSIAERLAALQAAGANDWRARVCRLSPENEDPKAIERAKNKINESLNAAVEEKKKIQIEDNEVGSNILADRRNKLENASQGWRKRVPQSDASLFTVAGRLERDKVPVTTPPLTPPAVPTPPTPGIPLANKFRSRKPPTSPTNGFLSGPLRSASCAVVTQSSVDLPKSETKKIDREAFKRSHSVSENISHTDDKEDLPPGVEKAGTAVRVPRADDETFHAFFTPALQQDRAPAGVAEDLDLDLDAIDTSSRQLLASDWQRRAKRERKHAASRNPLKALAARTDLREEYSPTSTTTIRDQYIKEKATANCGLAAEALAALATKEDFSNVSLKSAAALPPPGAGSPGGQTLMLLHVKGRRRVQTRLVEAVHSNVNRGDCFILVTPDNLFLYIGKYANVIERNRSTDIALHIQNTKDLGCKNSPSLYTIDEQNKIYSHRHWNQFWSLLGVKTPAEYQPIETGHADEDEIFESCIIQTNMCYEMIDDELVPIKEYWGQVPKISMLHQSKVIVFDFGAEMYIWYGKNVLLETRRRAAQLAQELFDDGYNYTDCHINPLNVAMYQGARNDIPALTKTSKTRPEWSILTKVTQHMETILFKEKFIDWPDYSRVIKVKPQENKINGAEITPCDGEAMFNNKYEEPDLVLEGTHVGRGTHYYDKETLRHFEILTRSVSKWIVRENDYQKVEKESELCEFFSGDSYIIRWEYQVNAIGRELTGNPSKHNVTGRDRCAYFCWHGRDATSNEKGTAALLTVELDKEKGSQMRVSQGCEPPAFLNLFQGKLVIHQGKKDTDKNRYKLYVTRGNVANEAYLYQVPCSVRQLRSRGSLLLVDTEKGLIYIWHGSRSMKHTKNIAIELANKLKARACSYLFGSNVSNVKVSEVKETEEPKEFLEALGGNKQFYNAVLNSGSDLGVDVTPRLFHFTDLSGQFEANEVLSPLRHEQLVTPFPFEQKELYSVSQPGLFLLDDGRHVWLWQGWWPRGEDGELEPAERNTGVGAFAGRWQSSRVAALQTCERYWHASASAQRRGVRCDIRVVTAGLEPQAFTELFDTWQEHDEAADANIAHGYKSGEILSGACELSRLTSQDAVLPLAALQRRPLPEHVNPQHLERHLASPDFMEAFGMSKEEFSALPAWKQTNMKKDVGLF